MKRYKRKKKIQSQVRTTVAFLLIISFILVAAAWAVMKARSGVFHYEKAINETVITMQGQEVKLRELSYYFMVEEETVHETALVYDPENPRAYWNIYIDNTYVSTAAKDTAIDYFLRDRIYYELAIEEGMNLSQKEWEEIYVQADAIITDMTEKQKSLQMTEEDLILALERNQLADDYVITKAKEQNLAMSEEVLSAYFGLNSPFFKEQKEKADLQFNEKILEKIKLGGLTIN